MTNKNDDSFKDLSPQLQTHCDDVEELMEMLKAFHMARENTYALSFARRGESGVWMNLARKYDRLDRLVVKVLGGGMNGVTLVDTLVDIALYALKWIAVIRRIRPDDFESWCEKVYDVDVDESKFDDDEDFDYTLESVYKDGNWPDSDMMEVCSEK